MEFIVTKEISYAMKEAKSWFFDKRKSRKPTFEIAGPAGSGKSTAAKYIISELGLDMDEVLVVAYVGKAAYELIKKDTHAQTIHSAIYDYVERDVVDDTGKVKLDDSGRAYTTKVPVLKKELDDNIRLILLDEGSMVDKKIADDLLSFKIPIMVLGDINQLPPVFGKPVFLQNPDVILTQIMRQALDSPIIYLSQKVIAGEALKPGTYGNNCAVISKTAITDDMFVWSDINLCAKNETRDVLNSYIRKKILHIDNIIPVIGDKLVCRNNDRSKFINDIYLINGMVGLLSKIHLDKSTELKLNIDFLISKDAVFENLDIDYKYLTGDAAYRKDILNKPHRSFDISLFEYAYVLTVHLAQGSQYPKVFIYNERMGSYDYYRKWMYTAITRASDELIIAI